MSAKPPKVASAQRIFQILLALPSESKIHFINFAVLTGLSFCFVIFAPAWPLFFDERRNLTGVAFCCGLLALVLVSLRARLSRMLSIAGKPKIVRTNWVQALVRLFPANVRSAVLARYIVPAAEPFPESPRSERFRRFYSEEWTKRMSGACPRLYWSFRNLKSAAQTIGSSQSPGILVSGGLVAQLRDAPEVVQVYLTHEFGHIANRDLEVFAWTIALARTCEVLFPMSAVALVWAMWSFRDGGLGSALMLMALSMWAFSLVILWLFVARYAGVIVSLRELYADVWAIASLGGIEGFDRVLEQQLSGGLRTGWQKFRSLLSLRLIHLSPIERRQFLSNPTSLILPRIRYFAFTAVLLFLLECSPFTTGYGTNAMRISLLVAWPPFAFAYLSNVGRSVAGLALADASRFWLRCIVPSLFLGVVLILPVFHLPMIYPDLVVWVAQQESITLTFRDDWSQFTLQANRVHPLQVLGLSYAFMFLGTSLASPRAGPGLDFKYFSRRVSRSLGRAAFVGILIESVLLFFLHYEPLHDELYSVLKWWAPFRGFTVTMPLMVMMVIMGADLGLPIVRSWLWGQSYSDDPEFR